MSDSTTSKNTRPGPLAGLLVLDLTRVLAGPYATMVLADLGARVVKVECPDGGDDARGFGPFVNQQSVYFASLNRGKQSLALDLKAADDRQLFEQLVGKADVLVENYRPGTLQKLGYAWEALHALNPRLVYAALSGFGHSGPYRQRPAYDLVVQGMGGMMSITGQAAAAPTRVGASIGDLTAGLFGLSGILAALLERHHSGEGRMVDVAMLDCQVALLENAIGRYLATGQIPTPLGARHPSITPFDAFKTQGEHIIIAAGNNALFKKLCVALHHRALAARAEFQTNHLRTENHALLKQAIEQRLADKHAPEWLRLLGDAGVPCGPINNIAAVVDDQQLAARNMIISTQHPQAGEIRMPGNPIKLSGFPDPQERRAAPELDADRQAVLDLIYGQ